MPASSPHRIAVLGAVVVDHLLHCGHTQWTTSYGGILYNTLRLAPLLAPHGCVSPVAWIGRAHHAKVIHLLSQWDNVDTSRLLVCEEGSDENTLRFTSPTNRQETMIRRCPGLPREVLAELRFYDWVHFNCITQKELSTGDLAFLREGRGVLSLDLHNRAASFDEDGHLLHARFPDWREWLSQVDVVQMNEHECGAILERMPESEDDFREAARRIADCGVREILTTWGARGSFLAYRETPDTGKPESVKTAAGESLRFAHIPPTSHPAVDTTGCGDSFSAAYQSRRLLGMHPIEAALFASAVSGWNATRTGLFHNQDVAAFTEIMQSELAEPLQRFAAGWRGEEL